MKQSIIHISLLVRDYDEALDFYIRKLGFDLVEDTRLSETKRWGISNKGWGENFKRYRRYE